MIHQTAIVDDAATLADDCSVGAYSIIGPEVEIGPGTEVGPHVVIKGPTRIGQKNRIFQFSSIGDDPQDLKYDGERTTLEIGDNNTIREYVTINRGTGGGGGVTRVGDSNLLMAYIHIAHDCQVGNQIIMANGSSLAGHVSVGNHAILAGFCCIHQFCVIGEHAFVGLNSVANKDVTPFTMVVGNYATARSINKEGLRRRGFAEQEINDLHRTFVEVVKSKGERETAFARVKPLAERSASVARLLEFVEQSERGIIRG